MSRLCIAALAALLTIESFTTMAELEEAFAKFFNSSKVVKALCADVLTGFIGVFVMGEIGIHCLCSATWTQ